MRSLVGTTGCHVENATGPQGFISVLARHLVALPFLPAPHGHRDRRISGVPDVTIPGGMAGVPCPSEATGSAMPLTSKPALSWPASPFSALARHSVALPLAAAGLGALLPGAADAAHAALPVTVPTLVALAVLATEVAPPSQQEAETVLLMLLATTAFGPLAVVGLCATAGLPRDLGLAAVLLATAPVGLSAGVLSQGLGVPARPAVWAAMLGLLAGPAVLSAAAALGGGVGLLAPGPLACRAVLSGALPALAAFAVRRAAPRAVAALLPSLRGLVVLALVAVLLAAGGGLRAAALAAPDAGAAVALSLATLAASAAVAVLTGRLLGGSGALPLAVAGSARNASFAWAAAAGSLSARGDLVLATAVVAAFAVPPVLRAASSGPGRNRLTKPHGPPGHATHPEQETAMHVARRLDRRLPEENHAPPRSGPLPVLAFALCALLAVAGTLLLSARGASKIPPYGFRHRPR